MRNIFADVNNEIVKTVVYKGNYLRIVKIVIPSLFSQ